MVGVGGSASVAAVGGADVEAAAVTSVDGDWLENFTIIGGGSLSAGPQIALTGGPTAIVAPYAEKPQDLVGDTVDIHIRFGFQATISIPTAGEMIDDHLKGLAISVDFIPDLKSWGFGIGLGHKLDILEGLKKLMNPC